MAQEDGTQIDPPDCPLCGALMTYRKRNALSRTGGFAVLYLACFIVLWLLPRMDAGLAAGMALLAAWGLYLMRSAPRWWCPDCWFECRPEECEPAGRGGP